MSSWCAFLDDLSHLPFPSAWQTAMSSLSSSVMVFSAGSFEIVLTGT